MLIISTIKLRATIEETIKTAIINRFKRLEHTQNHQSTKGSHLEALVGLPGIWSLRISGKGLNGKKARCCFRICHHTQTAIILHITHNHDYETFITRILQH